MAPLHVKPAAMLCFMFSILTAFQCNASIIRRQQTTLFPAANASLPMGWSYVGCYNDTQQVRTLDKGVITDKAMNGSTCAAYCNSKKFVYAGTEYTNECYCGMELGAPSSLQNDTSCNMPCNGNSSEACGGSNFISIYYANKPAPAGPVTNPGPTNWTQYGCYQDSNTRTLKNGLQTPGGPTNMTVALCTTTCGNAGYTLAGLEYAQECFCDNFLADTAKSAVLKDCNMACNGNSSEFCGAGNRLNLYALGNTQPCMKDGTNCATKATLPVVSTSTAASSSATSSSSSTASSSATSSSSTAVSSGTTTTSSADVTIDAVTKKSSTTTAVSSSTTTSTKSSTTTSAASSTTSACTSATPVSCPGSNGTTVTSNCVSFLIECGIDHQGGDLKYVQVSNFGQCVDACANTPGCVDVSLSGVACYMKSQLGAAVNNGGIWGAKVVTGAASSPSSSKSSTASSMSSTATAVTSTASSATSSTASGTSSTASATASAPAGVNAAAIAPYKYAGCYTDTDAGGRSIGNRQTDDPKMTVESCIKTCSAKGYNVAGMQYAQECYCDNFLRNSPKLVNDTDCNMNCVGNSAEKCGAGGRNSVYTNGTIATYQPPGPNTNLTGNWTYAGCIQDNVNNVRVFPYEMIFQTNNSNAYCTTLCQQYGYNAAATEYGEQCFCGDPSDVINAGAQMLPNSTCNVRCTNDTAGSNGGEICGGQNALSYYTWKGDPLNSWNYATGNAAGAYQFLIGGVVIPLIVTPARNGKVTFVEKFGTSENASSTGAYELDLTQINDFSKAWRTMHVKTDVFCAASLTLPDRAGRQIDVGGWSAPSTRGVRLYWPDGSPGVAGVNDWQENVDKLSLIMGRWYPSAMILANGSILVVGGEEGSNGAPVPSLEVLPSPSGQVLQADYLERTDPNNLYPFLTVLPSGRIFIQYYNEAKLLDPVSLQPVKDLPNAPGSVNNAGSGRTYPFAGTMMILPQAPPYTDLEVLICGGSNAGAAVALDNCVSMHPDQPNANWTLERMPSKRVMPCMTALPDGTYLIVNGAHQGTAGFGLATDPNLNAVLYDPTKPRGRRMTVMANTTVARLYHSESVLLDDGRVMITGSDPEDKKNPQEYRNEVFIPPYLMGNPSRPSFNITNLDWSYGSSQTLQILSQGGGGGFRVSMMGAVSSTHGNSMGQRTFFLATSCSGSSCTVTAPPNANVCPPGWFQLFLLDGKGVPSTAIWVRVGGDPASLGNWPQNAGFQLPGMGAVQRLF